MLIALRIFSKIVELDSAGQQESEGGQDAVDAKFKDHWGELVDKKRKPLPDKLIREIISEAGKPVKPKEYITLKKENEEQKVKIRDIPPVNEVLRHTIRLNFYSKRLQRYIRDLQLKKSKFRGPPLSEVKALPELPARQRRDRSEASSALPGGGGGGGGGGAAPGSAGGGCPPLPGLDEASARRLLERAVLAVLAGAGYDRADRSALSVLVDVLAEFIAKICQLSHSFAQHDLNRGQVAYDDVLEKSLRTVGLDGIHGVKEYYRRKVLLKRDRARVRALRCQAVYDKLLGKYGFPSSLVGVVASQQQQLQPPQLQPMVGQPSNSCSLLTGREELPSLQTILEPGFKMLQAMDQASQQHQGLLQPAAASSTDSSAPLSLPQL